MEYAIKNTNGANKSNINLINIVNKIKNKINNKILKFQIIIIDNNNSNIIFSYTEI